MKTVKNAIWILVLVWMSTVVFNSIATIYHSGGIWNIVAWVIMLCGVLVWAFTVLAAIRIIKNRNVGENKSPTTRDSSNV